MLYTHNSFAAGNFHRANGVSISYVVGVSERSGVVPLALFSLIQCVAGWQTSNPWKTFAGLKAAAFLPLIVLKTFLAFMATQVANRSQSSNVTAGVVFLGLYEDDPVQH